MTTLKCFSAINSLAIINYIYEGGSLSLKQIFNIFFILFSDTKDNYNKTLNLCTEDSNE